MQQVTAHSHTNNFPACHIFLRRISIDCLLKLKLYEQWRWPRNIQWEKCKLTHVLRQSKQQRQVIMASSTDYLYLFPVRIGQASSSHDDFMNMMKDWGIADNFFPFVKHSRQSRVIITFRENCSCPFFLHWNYVRRSDHALVIRANIQHTCVGVSFPSR
jgi:hypothetical protein